MNVTWAATARESGVFCPDERSSDVGEPADHFSELRSRGQEYLEVRLPEHDFPRVHHDVARDIERGSIGDQREAPGSADDLVVRTVLPGASRLSTIGAPLPHPSRIERFT